LAKNGVSDALVEKLERLIRSGNENNLIGVVLAKRLGLDSVAAMDDHTADFVLARSNDKLWPTMQEIVWARDLPDVQAARQKLMTYIGSAEGVRQGYIYMNSKAYQEATIDGDFGNAATTTDNDNVARHYLAWWQTRGLRMAANVVEAAGNQPGSKVLVIVGSSHKPYFDAYLDRMHDMKIMSVQDILSD
ncbi:MAG: DUF5694 domain-containing protein, partial [Pseudomonadota bacterium]